MYAIHFTFAIFKWRYIDDLILFSKRERCMFATWKNKSSWCNHEMKRERWREKEMGEERATNKWKRKLARTKPEKLPWYADTCVCVCMCASRMNINKINGFTEKKSLRIRGKMKAIKFSYICMCVGVWRQLISLSQFEPVCWIPLTIY